MADVFLSYSRPNREKVRLVATNLESDGRDVWWDEKLTGGDFFGATIEDQLDQANKVLVAWSRAARRSVWVRGEALEALDSGKLVQIQLDGSRLPVPFNALHAIDFSEWRGKRNVEAWHSLTAALDNPAEGRPSQAVEPSPRKIGRAHRIPKPKLALTGQVLGGDTFSTAISIVAPLISALAVASVRTDLMDAQAFTLVSVVAFAGSFLALALSILRLVRTDTNIPRDGGEHADDSH